MKRILKNKIFLVLVTFLLTVSFAFSGMMVYNSLNPASQTIFEDDVFNYMEVDGIYLQESDPGVPDNAIKVNAIILAGLNLGASASGLRSERLQISDIVVEKFIDNIMTPQLWDYFFRNTRINRIVLYVFVPFGEGGISHEVTMTLDNVYISSIVNSYSTVSSEQITFRCSTLTLEFPNSGQSVTYQIGR